MKNTRVSFCIVTLIMAVFHLASIPRVHAFDEMDTDATVALLTSGPWKFSGHISAGWWSDVRIFNKDGVFTTLVRTNEHGHWKISGNTIILIFADQHQDIITLPLNPKGTAGVSSSGNPMTCALVSSTVGNGTPPPASATNQTEQEAIDILTTGQWRLSGNGWDCIRKFNRDGTLITLVGRPKSGTWKIVNNEIVITLSNRNVDKLSLPLDPKHAVGIDAKGNQFVGVQEPDQSPDGAFGSKSQTPGGAQAQTPPPAAISPELQQKASDLIKTYHNSLVFVTGKDASGSGFIAAIGNSNFLVTNAHVAADINDAAFKTLDDTPVKGGAASVAVGRDIFCMAQPAGGKPLDIMQDVEGNAAIGDDVVVLGNADGEGVINTITGKIVGVGPNLVEVDAPFVPGNSGSPIIHLNSGKVIGVATYTVTQTYDATTKEKIAKPVIRRFGYRLDNLKSWQAVDWRSFYTQAAEMEKVETLTADLGDFFRDLEENKGSVTPGRHTNPVIKDSIDRWERDRTSNRSAADENAANASFFAFLKVACQSDVAAARQHMTYDYFQRKLAGEQKTRDEMSKAFEQIIKDLSN